MKVYRTHTSKKNTPQRVPTNPIPSLPTIIFMLLIIQTFSQTSSTYP